MIPDTEILALHRDLVAIKSVSKGEAACVDHVAAYLSDHGAAVTRTGRNLLARAGRGPALLFNSHLDTVPATAAWTRDPWRVTVEDGKVYGLGSNDAKAAVAAMIVAFLDVVRRDGPCDTCLMLVVDEETGGEGTEVAWPALSRAGFAPAGVVVGEPTGLDIVVAQKGLLILELIAEGDACHAAHAARLGARNAIFELARDLRDIEGMTLGREDRWLGATTLQPTMMQAGTARNVIPERAGVFLDVRTVPGASHDDVVEQVAARVAGTVKVVSSRLVPRACHPEAAIARAAALARDASRFVGSSTMSDMVHFDAVPVIKCGPGDTSRSHRPDEWVHEDEVLAGARFYARLVETFAETAGTEAIHDAALGKG